MSESQRCYLFGARSAVISGASLTIGVVMTCLILEATLVGSRIISLRSLLMSVSITMSRCPGGDPRIPV